MSTVRVFSHAERRADSSGTSHFFAESLKGRRKSMSKAKSPAAPAVGSTDGVAKLLQQYGCGPIAFTGTDDALYERHVIFDHVARLADATPRDRFEAFAQSVRDILSQRWVLTNETYDRENSKRIYYLSMEFLIGRSLANNVTNLLLEPLARKSV